MTDTIEQREDADKLMSDAMTLMRRAYYGTVKGMAEDLKDRIQRDEITDREQLDDAIHEDCDGSQWVIYTYRAQQVLMASDNDDAYADDFGAEGIVTDGSINWSALAYAALRRDLTEQLEAEGVDVNGETKNELLGIANALDPDAIPDDFPVRPLEPGAKAKERATCGECGLSWDDAIVTSMTPTPSGRCPFEQFHEEG